MRKTAVTFEAVRALRREFPDLHESTMYGSPALKLGKRLVACLAIHRSAEPGSLVVRTDFEQRPALLDDDPETQCRSFRPVGRYSSDGARSWSYAEVSATAVAKFLPMTRLRGSPAVLRHVSAIQNCSFKVAPIAERQSDAAG
jgi:hypothetical protein